jgi:hypothetical protein
MCDWRVNARCGAQTDMRNERASYTMPAVASRIRDDGDGRWAVPDIDHLKWPAMQTPPSIRVKPRDLAETAAAPRRHAMSVRLAHATKAPSSRTK